MPLWTGIGRGLIFLIGKEFSTEWEGFGQTTWCKLGGVGALVVSEKCVSCLKADGSS